MKYCGVPRIQDISNVWHNLATSRISDRTTKLQTIITHMKYKLYLGTLLQFGIMPGILKV